MLDEKTAERIRKETQEWIDNHTPRERKDEMDNIRGLHDPETRFRYNLLWQSVQKDDPDGTWSEKDKLKYPQYGWVDYNSVPLLGEVSAAINRLKDVSCGKGTMYETSAVRHGKVLWWLQFHTIEAYQHFLWAGCFRYFPLSKCDDWLLTVDDGDTDYKYNKGIRMVLQYQDTDAPREKWEEDIKKFADGVNKYADDEEDIRKRLTEDAD